MAEIMESDVRQQNLETLKLLINEHEYARAIYFAKEMLKTDSEDKEVKALLKKAQQISSNHEIKWSIVFVFVAVFFILIAVLSVNKKMLVALNTQNYKINSLINEIGALQEENFNLFLQQSSQKKDMDYVAFLLGGITDQFDNWKSAEKDLDVARNELQKTKEYVEQLQKNNANSKMNLSKNLKADSLGASHQAILDENFDVLILGMHGSLTDTIILASMNFSKKSINLFSIPRDLYVNGRKINEVYLKYGINKVAETVYEITGIFPDNYAVVDLNSFVEIVDILGGIDVVVEKAIYDNQYPGANNTYTVFSVDKGLQHMDGQLALKYARSRKSSSDFDRAARQHQVIAAVRDKLKALNLFNDLEKAVNIYLSIKDNLQTDVDIFKALSYAKDFQEFQINSGNVLSTSNFLYSTYNQRGQYILLPNSGNYEEIKAWINELE